MLSPMLWRFALFLAVLIALSVAEHWLPATRLPPHRYRLRMVNFGLGVLGALSGRLLAATLGVLAARQLSLSDYGPLALLQSLAPLSALGRLFGLAVGLLSLDVSLYLQHRLFHVWPWLWRWHAVHHSDAQLDASSALRFHPVEIALSWVWKLAVVVTLGIAPFTLFVFEMMLSSMALFNHCNLRLSSRLEQHLAPWLITPAIHRLHHRREGATQAPNYGFSVPWWDRIAGTWQGHAAETKTVPPVGLADWPEAADAGLLVLLNTKTINS
jgi:sterol desaturase/sphingolipid hydroxylase (fatty acid hydroxylase superfamily)